MERRDREAVASDDGVARPVDHAPHEYGATLVVRARGPRPRCRGLDRPDAVGVHRTLEDALRERTVWIVCGQTSRVDALGRVACIAYAETEIHIREAARLEKGVGCDLRNRDERPVRRDPLVLFRPNVAARGMSHDVDVSSSAFARCPLGCLGRGYARGSGDRR